jgi:hypothetical protein
MPVTTRTAPTAISSTPAARITADVDDSGDMQPELRQVAVHLVGGADPDEHRLVRPADGDLDRRVGEHLGTAGVDVALVGHQGAGGRPDGRGTRGSLLSARR